MKLLVALFMVIAVSFVQAQTSEQAELLKKHHTDCAKEVTIDQELITKARNGEYSDKQALKDFLFCVAKKAGLINDAGVIQKDTLLKKTSEAIGKDLATKVVGACSVEQKNGPETALHVVKCFREKSAPKFVNII